MIGDSYEADIAGAIALGMQAIQFNSHNEIMAFPLPHST